MRYSPSTRTCYPEGIKYKNLPDDLVNFDNKYHGALILAVNHGKKIAFINGSPVISEPDVDLQALAMVKNEARRRLTEVDQVALRCFKDGTTFPAEWRIYEAALLTIAESGQVPAGGMPNSPPIPN